MLGQKEKIMPAPKEFVANVYDNYDAETGARISDSPSTSVV